MTVLAPAPKRKQKTAWYYQCECGRTGIATSTNLKRGRIRSCGKCARPSVGEELVEQWLKSHQIMYEREKQFIQCQDSYRLRFDFFLPDYGLAIEFDGEMHYITTSLNNDLDGQQRRDKIKTDYCIDNGIVLLRIPYWDRGRVDEILDEWILFK